MNTIIDIVGKDLTMKSDAIFAIDSTIMKGTILAFNKNGYVKVRDSLTGKEFISKNPSREIYQIPEYIDLSEELGFNPAPVEKKESHRNLDREMSMVKDVMGNGVIYGDKILLVVDSELMFGRTFNLKENENKITVTLVKKDVDVEFSSNNKNIYLLKPDYYIKEKSLY